MGQINTTNYPTVSSLADADLLIVENAVHGTGTTTPKQLRENAIGTDVLKTTAQTVTGAINEIWETAGALRGSGKAVSVTNNIIDTDIDLGRAPQVGDRILVLFDSSVTSVNAIKTYDGSTAVQTPWENVPVLDFHLNGVCIIEFIANPLSPDPTAICARLVRMFEGTVYTAGTGIGIDNGTITNTKPQMGVNIDGGTINSVSSGNLGSYAKAAKYIVMTFNCNAVAYDGAYHLILSASGSVVVMYEAVLVDPVTGGRYTKDIKKYTTLVCEVTTTGAGTSADPILVNVIGEITNDLADKVDAVLDAISEEKTVSGNPIVIADALALPAKSLEATLNAIQDLHGYDHPWAGGAGKNKFGVERFADNARASHEYTESLGKLKVTKTVSGNWAQTQVYIKNGNALVGQTVTLSISSHSQNNPNTKAHILMLDGNNSISGSVLANGEAGTFLTSVTFTVPSLSNGLDILVRIDQQDNGQVGDYLILEGLQLEIAPSATTFAPYTNICPISGRTEARVDDVGKNLLPLTLTGLKALNTQGTWADNVYTINTVTYTVYTDSADRVSSIKVNGTPNSTTQFFLSKSDLAFSIATLLSSGIAFNSQSAFMQGRSGVDGSYIYYNADVNGVSVPANTALNHIYIAVASGKTANNVVVYPMLRDASISDNAFEPYTPSSVTIQLGQTVYGGQVDFKTGRVTVTKASVDMGSIEWTYDSSKAFFKYTMPSTFKNNSSLVCSIYPYKGQRNDGQMDTAEYGIYDVNTTIKVKDTRYTDATAYTTAVTGQTLCYELSTPTELTLTPAQLEMLKGYNRVTMDNGNISLTYKANRLDALMAALQNT